MNPLKRILYPVAQDLRERDMAERTLRVLVAKPGLDGHDRGARILARAFRDAGFEVVYTGCHQTPEQIVNAALQEDADCVGLSCLSGAHKALFPKVVDMLRDKGAEDIVVIGGGIIPKQDIDFLHQRGVQAIFTPGTPLEEIISWVKTNVHPRDEI